MNTRNLGLNHFPGKGDKSRVSDDTRYKQNLSEIKFSGVTGLTPGKRPGSVRKVYR